VLFPELRAVEVIALLVLAALTLVQWFGVKWGGVMQDITSLLKALAFLILIAACFYLGHREASAKVLEVIPEGSVFLAYILALQAVIYTYDGWTAVIYFSEEVKDPGRNIPRAMFGGVIAVMAIYLLLNIAFLRVVPLATIAGEKLAAGVVAQHMFRPYGDTVIRSLTIVALFSAVNSNVLMAPRVLFAMSRDRLFWRGAAEVNKGGTPDVSLLLSSMMAAAFIVSGRFDQVIAVLSFFFVANYALSFASLFKLRRREPDAPRPWRAIGHPFTTGLALLASVAFLVGAVISDTRNSVYALILLAVSWPVYLISSRKANDDTVQLR
jgi:APA family basic amino acid/polyamine antiporter